MQKHLHIVCHDVPYPVDYGGVFDIYYKIVALHKAGVNIHLHCFAYGRERQPHLEQFCAEVFYYPRKFRPGGFVKQTPYIVSSRADSQLLSRLQCDDYPILMEGVHTTGFLQNGKLDPARCHVRFFNVEHLYYEQLARYATSLSKKLYYTTEAKWLKTYERKLAGKARFYTVGLSDLEYFKSQMGYRQVVHLPLFLEGANFTNPDGVGDYCLYQGNLSVPENEYAATWLIKKVCSRLPQIRFVFAGKNPEKKLQRLSEKMTNVMLEENPDEGKMRQLIEGAQIHLLPSFNRTGIKLKLLRALYHGRHCLTNYAGADGQDLQNICLLAETPEEFISQIKSHMEVPVRNVDYSIREQVLRARFHNERNAAYLVKEIWPEKN